MTTFSIKECIEFGWRTFKTRPGFFILVSVVLFAVSLASGFLQGLITAAIGKSAGGLISFLIALVVDVFIGMGTITVYLKAHDSVMTPEIKDLWQPARFWNYLGAAVLMGIVLVVGYILLIVPGVILSVVLVFTTILVVDKGLRPVEALKESARLTKGHRWQLFLLLLAVIALNAVGLIVLVVGLLVSIPVTVLAIVHVYRHLSGATGVPVAPVATLDHTPTPMPATDV